MAVFGPRLDSDLEGHFDLNDSMSLFFTLLFPGWAEAKHQKGEKEVLLFCTDKSCVKENMPYVRTLRTSGKLRVPLK